MPAHAELDPLVLESFTRNGEVNAALLANLTFDDLSVADGRGGWSIGEHLGHLAAFRPGWLSIVSPRHARTVPWVIDGDEDAFQLTATSVDEIAHAFEAGDAAAVQAVRAALAEDQPFTDAYERHPAHFLIHTIVHDAHHRGQITALLRTSGRRTPEQLGELEGRTWPIWRR